MRNFKRSDLTDNLYTNKEKLHPRKKKQRGKLLHASGDLERRARRWASQNLPDHTIHFVTVCGDGAVRLHLDDEDCTVFRVNLTKLYGATA